jgi:AcrR family transcriptional regulator
MFGHKSSMSRRKVISDQDVLALLHAMLLRDGEKRFTFQSAAQACGLSAPALVQRFQSRDDMLVASLRFGWDRLSRITDTAEAEAPLTPKGAQSMLKMIAASEDIPALFQASFRHPALQAQALDWRIRLEAALAPRLGQGNRGRVAAALIFAVWQGRMLWGEAGGKSFKLGDALRHFGG